MRRQVSVGLVLLSVLVLLSCSTTRNFESNLPNVSPWADLKIHFLKTDDGIELAYRELGDIKSKRALIIVPGSTMYGYYYIPFMRSISGNNIYTRVIDIRGHGDSGGRRGDVSHENSLADDLALHIKNIRLMNPNAQLFLAGHSMGAGICGRYLEKYGFDSVNGVIYFAPFFHYKQPGMKNVNYVEVSIFKTLFGDLHEVTQVYHPATNDSKLVTEYTKIMSIASMVGDYNKFRTRHTTRTLFMIGKQDELFEWEDAMSIFGEREEIVYSILQNSTHLNLPLNGADKIKNWIKRQTN